MKKILPLLVIISIVVIVYFNTNEDDSSYFESYLNEMITAGEKKDFESFVDFFSIHYRDEHGINYIYIKNIVKNQFEKYDGFQASYEDVSVSEIYKDDSGNEMVDINLDVFVTGSLDGVPVVLVGTGNDPDNITITLRETFMNQWEIVRIEDLDEPVR